MLQIQLLFSMTALFVGCNSIHSLALNRDKEVALFKGSLFGITAHKKLVPSLTRTNFVQFL